MARHPHSSVSVILGIVCLEFFLQLIVYLKGCVSEALMLNSLSEIEIAEPLGIGGRALNGNAIKNVRLVSFGVGPFLVGYGICNKVVLFKGEVVSASLVYRRVIVVVKAHF